MMGHLAHGVAAALIAGGMCGCPRTKPITPESSRGKDLRPAGPARPAEPARPAREEGWTYLFDGDHARHWRTLQGSAALKDRAIVLDGRKKDVTIMARGVKLENGIVEMTVRRRAEADNHGPYTLGVRLPFTLRWHSVYFVCRPDSVEACKATYRRQTPPPEVQAQLPPAQQPVVWRLVMDEKVIDCYRAGKRVLRYEDRDPSEGGLALTASRCIVDVLEVRYKPAE